MKIALNTNEILSGRQARYIKWRLYQLKEKFKDILYAEVFVNTEGKKPQEYQINLKLGVPGQDIFVSHRSDQLDKLIQHLFQDAQRYLAKRNGKLAW